MTYFNVTVTIQAEDQVDAEQSVERGLDKQGIAVLDVAGDRIKDDELLEQLEAQPPKLLDNMKRPGIERNAIERADVMAKLIGIVTGQMGVVTKCSVVNDIDTPDSEVEHQVDLDVESMGFLYNVRINVNRFSTPEIEAQCRREDAENSNEPVARN